MTGSHEVRVDLLRALFASGSERVPVLPVPAGWESAAGCAGRWDLVDVVSAPQTRSAAQRRERAWAVSELLTLCAACPVVAECAALGAATKASGVWGGVELVDGLPLGTLGVAA